MVADEQVADEQVADEQVADEQVAEEQVADEQVNTEAVAAVEQAIADAAAAHDDRLTAEAAAADQARARLAEQDASGKPPKVKTVTVKMGERPSDADLGLEEGKAWGVAPKTILVEFIPFNSRQPSHYQFVVAGQPVSRAEVDGSPMFQKVASGE